MPEGRPPVRLPSRYRILHHLADGGMAAVWAAQDELLDRRVAVKVLAPAYAADPAARRRFAREARAAARLSSHPHVVMIFDIGEADDQAFIVMEHFAGGSVRERLRDGDIPPDTALRWLGEAASALDAAHAKDIVHRDVKPGNLLLDEHARLAVGDFGIASLAGETQVTQAGQVLGTAAYLSPEQARGAPATPASDRYALAVVAYELLHGHRPDAGDVPATGALARGLEEDPARRPRSSGAFVQELRAEHGDQERTIVARRFDKPATDRFGRGEDVRTEGRTVEETLRTEADADAAVAARGRGARRDDARLRRTAAKEARAAGGEPRPAGGRSRRLAPVAALAALLLAGGGVAAVVASQGGDGGGTGGGPAAVTAATGDEAAGTDDAAGSGTSKGGAAGTDDAAGSGTSEGGAAGTDDAAGSGTSEGGTAGSGAGTATEGQATDTAPAETTPPATTPTAPAGNRSPSELNDAGFALLPGDPGQAIPLLEQAVTGYRQSGQTSELGYAYALYNLGWALRLGGRPAEAIPYLTERLQVSSNQRGVVRAELRAAQRDARGT